MSHHKKMSHRKNQHGNRATSQPPKGGGRHRRLRHQSSDGAAGTALSRAPQSRLGQHRRRSVHRPYMTTGVAIVGASAIVGSSIALPPADVETTRVQLTTAESTAPTPNPLLAARVETSKRSTCEAVDARDDGWCAGTFPSLFTAVAGGLGIGLDIWDTTVGLGAAVVAGSAITAGLIGVGLDTALAE